MRGVGIRKVVPKAQGTSVCDAMRVQSSMSVRLLSAIKRCHVQRNWLLGGGVEVAYGKPRSETRTWPVSSWNVQNATGSGSPAARLPPSSADDTAAGDEDMKESNARGITDAGVAVSGGERRMGAKRKNK